MALYPYILTFIFSLGISLIMWRLNKKDKKDEALEKERKAREEAQEEKRKTRDVLILQGLYANYHVIKELVPCVRGTKKPNGELLKAEEWMTKTNNQIDDFLRREGVR